MSKTFDLQFNENFKGGLDRNVLSKYLSGDQTVSTLEPNGLPPRTSSYDNASERNKGGPAPSTSSYNTSYNYASEIDADVPPSTTSQELNLKELSLEEQREIPRDMVDEEVKYYNNTHTNTQMIYSNQPERNTNGTIPQTSPQELNLKNKLSLEEQRKILSDMVDKEVEYYNNTHTNTQMIYFPEPGTNTNGTTPQTSPQELNLKNKTFDLFNMIEAKQWQEVIRLLDEIKRLIPKPLSTGPIQGTSLREDIQKLTSVIRTLIDRLDQFK